MDVHISGDGIGWKDSVRNNDKELSCLREGVAGRVCSGEKCYS